MHSDLPYERLARYRRLGIIVGLVVVLSWYILHTTRLRTAPEPAGLSLELLWSSPVDYHSSPYVAFGPNGELLAYCSANRETSFLDVSTLTVRETMPTPHVQFAPRHDPPLVASLTDGQVVLQALHDKHELAIVHLPKGFWCYNISADGRRVAGTTKTSVFVLDVSLDKAVDGCSRQPARSSDFAVLSPDGRFLAYKDNRTGANGREIRAVSVRDIDHNTEICTIRRRGGGSAQFSPNGRFIVIPYSSEEVRVWDLEAGRWLGTRIDWRDAGVPNVVSYSPDGKLIASGGTNLRTEDSIIKKLRGREATRSLGAALKISDAQTGRLLWETRITGSGQLTSLSFSPDGTMLAASIDHINASVLLWRIDRTE